MCLYLIQEGTRILVVTSTQVLIQTFRLVPIGHFPGMFNKYLLKILGKCAANFFYQNLLFKVRNGLFRCARRHRCGKELNRQG